MRTAATCSCGWRRELSEFYAGRRIRCPDCACIVEIPGQINEGADGQVSGLYASPRIEGSLRRAAAPASAWLPLVRWDASSIQHPPVEQPRDERMPGWAWLVILAVLIGAFVFSLGSRPERSKYSVPHDDVKELPVPSVDPEAPQPDSAPDPEEEDEF